MSLIHLTLPAHVPCSWERLRTTEGWAAFQHHAVLHTTLTLQQIGGHTSAKSGFPRIHVQLEQASYFCLRPKDFESATFVPQWYPGNIYAMERSEPISVSLPPSTLHDGLAQYDIFISGDYEVAMPNTITLVYLKPLARSDYLVTQLLTMNNIQFKEYAWEWMSSRMRNR